MSQNIKNIILGTIAVLLVLYLFGKILQEWHTEEVTSNAGHKIQSTIQWRDSEDKEVDDKEDITNNKLSLKNEMRIFEDNNVRHERKMQKVDDLRRERLHKECSRLGHHDGIWSLKDLKKYPHLQVLVADRQHVLVCFTGDAQSEMWKNVLGNLGSLYAYPEWATTYRIKFFYKLLPVQQPIMRLMAAYKSWVVPVQEGRDPFGDKKLYEEMKKIFDKIRSEGHDGANSTRDTVFSDFVSFIVKQVQSKETLHPLWERISVLCEPCSMHYDYISRTETDLDDFQQLLPVLRNLPPARYTTVHNASSDAKMLEEIHRSLPPELLEQFYEAYKTDHKLFGYPKPWR